MFAQALEQWGRLEELFRGPCGVWTFFRQIVISVSVSAVKPLKIHSFWIFLGFHLRWLREDLLVGITSKSAEQMLVTIMKKISEPT